MYCISASLRTPAMLSGSVWRGWLHGYFRHVTHCILICRDIHLPLKYSCDIETDVYQCATATGKCNNVCMCTCTDSLLKRRPSVILVLTCPLAMGQETALEWGLLCWRQRWPSLRLSASSGLCWLQRQRRVKYITLSHYVRMLTYLIYIYIQCKYLPIKIFVKLSFFVH